MVALPLVGTGAGGKRYQAGAVARELLPVLYEHAERLGLDIALVTNEGDAFSAIQAERRTLGLDRSFPDQTQLQRDAASRLAERARRSGLVLFLGAGVSRSAGLPNWDELLFELARGAGMGTEEIDHLAEMGFLDRARLIDARLGAVALGTAVSVLLAEKSTHYGLVHGLLASLPFREAVTTNYDRLFEQALAAGSLSVAVLPYEPARAQQRWLLKMHGCVNHPEDIVLTREDFLGYRERREALAGIVQAMLMTKHMLFVGFSFNDENFHQIARAVRRALHRDSRQGRAPFGTSLMVGSNALVEELWRDDLHWLPFDGQTSEATRELEIFLDRVVAEATTATAHLFEARYREVLSSGEREFRDALESFVSDRTGAARDTEVWREFEAFLESLGWRGS